LLGGVPRYGNLLSPNRPDELDRMTGQGYEPPASASMTHDEAARAAQVVNAENAPEVAGAAMGLGMGPMTGTMSKVAQGLTSAMKNTLGPYGVTGLGRVAVGTPAFAQATPAMDTPPGVTDAGAIAAASSSLPGPVATGMGAFPGAAPPPDMMGGLPGFSDALSSFNQASGFGNAMSGLLGFGDQAPSPAQALGEVASGRAGRGSLEGFAERGFGADVFGGDGRGGDGSGRDGGRGGADSAYGGPDGVGRGNDRGGGIGF
jgi:hypothetical protein